MFIQMCIIIFHIQSRYETTTTTRNQTVLMLSILFSYFNIFVYFSSNMFCYSIQMWAKKSPLSIIRHHKHFLWESLFHILSCIEFNKKFVSMKHRDKEKNKIIITVHILRQIKENINILNMLPFNITFPGSVENRCYCQYSPPTKTHIYHVDCKNEDCKKITSYLSACMYECRVREQT